ncbi:TetR/AcrR family transcriptional regulator [Myceligenerans salitolerans]|uniref:TetR/AcrR family transcriptional regulator n=1 Tax=Myceligenerans salitolerans TaxID=1230528 RepID=A0ABS3I7K8_9MICO|nr:TetR/AcrR family transcriptional regulator [Myceligenerans salitolerans]MBO0608919.1 TetR/AcrR family transcriptional regulator [Myceligenerans salitolerans]
MSVRNAHLAPAGTVAAPPAARPPSAPAVGTAPGTPKEPAPDAIGERLLDAAGRLVSTRGLHGLTIAELAREAEVSRPTVYRRFGSSDDVVRALLGHRAHLLVTRARHNVLSRTRHDGGPPAGARADARQSGTGRTDGQDGGPPDRAAIVAGVLEFGDLFRADPVFRRLLRREPEVFTRYTLQRIGRSQRVIHEWIAGALAQAQAGGTVRAGDPHDMALMVLIVSQGALLSGPTVADLVDPDAWRAELAHALDAYLRP